MTDPLASLSGEYIAAARMGRTWPMLFAKQALAELPVEQAYAEFAAALQRPAGTLRRKDLLSARAFAESHAGYFHKLEPAGEVFGNTPAYVIGESDHRPLGGRKRSTYIAAFDSVTTRGRSQLIETPDSVLLDYEGEELARIDDVIELDSAVFRRDDHQAWIIDEPCAETLRVGQCFSLLGPNSYAFGHWIVEYLPRLWLARESGLMPEVPILIDHGMHRQHRQALEMLIPAGTPIIEVKPMQRVEIDRLWFAPVFYYRPIYPQFNQRFRYDFVAAPPDRFRSMFKAMQEHLPRALDTAGGVDKIFLARKPGGRRALVNGEIIEQIAEDSGFTRVYLEDLDFAEQLALVQRAKFLAGPEGSAFFMGFFAQPGAKACILNHPHTEYLTTVTALLDAMDVECTVLTGPFRRVDAEDYLHHSDYEIDPGVFESFLLDWSRQ